LKSNKIKQMKQIIAESLKKSQSYQEYRDAFKQLVENNSTTGNEKSENLIEFTKLNDRRMKRWDVTLMVPKDIQEKIEVLNNKVTWLVITESWCGDAAHVLPVINKIAELNENITFKTVLRDDNEALMNLFLTKGSKSVPKLIMIDDQTGAIVNTYGPRPSTAKKLVSEYKAEFGMLTPEFKQDIQLWYNKDKGVNVMEDLTLMLCELEPSVCL
jgi:thiol-disulfide isomerase/thioredoxin